MFEILLVLRPSNDIIVDFEIITVLEDFWRIYLGGSGVGHTVVIPKSTIDTELTVRIREVDECVPAARADGRCNKTIKVDLSLNKPGSVRVYKQ